jgi:hypothetical protein
MTELRPGSKLTRKTLTIVQRKPLVVTLHPGYLDIRRAGTRTAFSLTYDAVYRHAAQAAAERIRAERKVNRRSRL